MAKFQPGQSGNPNGRPKTKPFKDALKRAISEAGENDLALTEVAAALLEKAKGGDVQAIKELADRMDGKVAQPISGDDDEPPIQQFTTIELIGVRPADQDT